MGACGYPTGGGLCIGCDIICMPPPNLRRTHGSGGIYRMQLNASTRQTEGKRSRQLHREGKLSAVVYGHSAAATSLVLDRLEFQKVFVKSGRTHLVDLVV